jgi:hypothetical protein
MFITDFESIWLIPPELQRLEKQKCWRQHYFRTPSELFYTQNLVKIYHQAFIQKSNAKIMATLSQLFILGKKSRLNLNQKFYLKFVYKGSFTLAIFTAIFFFWWMWTSG